MENSIYTFLVSTISVLFGILFYIAWGPGWHLDKKDVIKNPVVTPTPLPNLTSPPVDSPFTIWYEKGRSEEQQGKLEEAVRCYAWALSYQDDHNLELHLEKLNGQIHSKNSQKTTWEQLYLEGQKLENAYQYQEAIDLYQKLQVPDIEALQKKLEACQLALAHQKLQKKLLQKAQQLDAEGQSHKAAKLYQKVIKIGNTIPLLPVREAYKRAISYAKLKSQVTTQTDKYFQQGRSVKALLHLQELEATGWNFPQLKAKIHEMFQKEMAYVPEGSFIMGSDERLAESPSRVLTLPAFYIDRYEVTNYQYLAFLHDTGKTPPKHWHGYTIPEGKAQHPVVGISWEEAWEYARWAGKKLPAESEWEKAARGPKGNIYPWGNYFAVNFCNTMESQVKGTARVGSYLKGISPYGCYDMIGNVLEWTDDPFFSYPGNSQKFVIPGHKVAKGGSWYYQGIMLSLSARYDFVSTTHSLSLGFRCALDADILGN